MNRRHGRHNSQVERRRQLVASYRLRQLTQHEIVDELAQLGIEVDRSTVSRDLQAIESRWRAESVRDIAEHKARQLAELQEVKRQAWADNNLGALLRAIEVEVRILGTDSPIKIDWRREAEQLGIDAGVLFDRMVAYVADNAEYAGLIEG